MRRQQTCPVLSQFRCKARFTAVFIAVNEPSNRAALVHFTTKARMKIKRPASLPVTFQRTRMRVGEELLDDVRRRGIYRRLMSLPLGIIAIAKPCGGLGSSPAAQWLSKGNPLIGHLSRSHADWMCLSPATRRGIASICSTKQQITPYSISSGSSALFHGSPVSHRTAPALSPRNLLLRFELQNSVHLTLPSAMSCAKWETIVPKSALAVRQSAREDLRPSVER